MKIGHPQNAGSLGRRLFKLATSPMKGDYNEYIIIMDKAYVPELDVTAQEYTDAMTLSGTKVEGFKEVGCRS